MIGKIKRNLFQNKKQYDSFQVKLASGIFANVKELRQSTKQFKPVLGQSMGNVKSQISLDSSKDINSTSQNFFDMSPIRPRDLKKNKSTTMGICQPQEANGDSADSSFFNNSQEEIKEVPNSTEEDEVMQELKSSLANTSHNSISSCSSTSSKLSSNGEFKINVKEVDEVSQK
jgi:hypothetical protein